MFTFTTKTSNISHTQDIFFGKYEQTKIIYIVATFARHQFRYKNILNLEGQKWDRSEGSRYSSCYNSYRVWGESQEFTMDFSRDQRVL